MLEFIKFYSSQDKIKFSHKKTFWAEFICKLFTTRRMVMTPNKWILNIIHGLKKLKDAGIFWIIKLARYWSNIQTANKRTFSKVLRKICNIIFTHMWRYSSRRNRFFTLIVKVWQRETSRSLSNLSCLTNLGFVCVILKTMLVDQGRLCWLCASLWWHLGVCVVKHQKPLSKNVTK